MNHLGHSFWHHAPKPLCVCVHSSYKQRHSLIQLPYNHQNQGINNNTHCYALFIISHSGISSSAHDVCTAQYPAQNLLLHLVVGSL